MNYVSTLMNEGYDSQHANIKEMRLQRNNMSIYRQFSKNHSS